MTTYDVASIMQVTLDVADWPVRRAAADTLSALMVALGRGVHSYTSQLNLSRFLSLQPLKPLNVSLRKCSRQAEM